MNESGSKDMARIAISPRASGRLRRGHLWVYANEIDMRGVPEEPGTWCVFVCKGSPVATGYFNRHSLIAGRCIASGVHEDLTALLRRRLGAAFARRRLLLARGSARLVFSEADFIPGLIVDWYGDVAVIQSNTAGIDTVLPILERLVPEVCEETLKARLSTVVVRADSSARLLEQKDPFKRVVTGAESAAKDGWVEEDGLKIAADFLDGQKTGYFLDQRDNRAFLETLVRRAERPPQVLDLCCYSGAWGLRALRAGATSVTFVDQSREALESVRRGVERNGLDAARAEMVCDDVFEYLSAAGGRYDLVVADPPAFVKSRKNLPQAVHAYVKLNRLAWRRVAPGGILLTCSCSHHIAVQQFSEILAEAVSREDGAGRVIFRGGQPEDHPSLLGMPETAYLKCLGVQKVDAGGEA